MIQCQGCGNTYADGVKYCMGCGRVVDIKPAPVKPSKCKKSSRPEDQLADTLMNMLGINPLPREKNKPSQHKDAIDPLIKINTVANITDNEMKWVRKRRKQQEIIPFKIIQFWSRMIITLMLVYILGVIL